MDRDVVNAIHALYQHGVTPHRDLLAGLWCGPDSEPDLDDLTDKRGTNYALNPFVIRFIKATEQQLSALPRPDFVFGFPLSQPPRRQGEPRPAFVAMPYGPDWFQPVSEAIDRSAKAKGFIAEVSKNLSKPGLITHQIWHGIRRAEVIVADITGSNANVFYELGLAHALGKEVVLLAQGTEQPPFDLSTSRLLRYSDQSIPALEAELQKAFASVSARYPFDGPQPYF
jgi:hypothetical protein